ncbi:unnamed protein product [Microthlaspi erraticum]|uniref:Uncharacterized protein n=1 Tax=Microthlaspi erraticum TaxID=1685480 RepID=A0A6D2HS04_9BRAS|nr:unnamed protein product [Microthlaspi erraticum]
MALCTSKSDNSAMIPSRFQGFRSLTVGDAVEFDITQGTNGKTKAVEVTALGGTPLNKRKEISFRSITKSYEGSS